MEKQKVLIVIGVLLIILLASFVIINNGFDKNALSAVIDQKPLPITLFYLDDSTVHFDCLDTTKCFEDVDLSNQIKAANGADHSLSLMSAFHGSDSNLYLFLSGTISNFLAKVNLETGQAQILDLNTPLLSDGNNPPIFLPGMGRMIYGKIVVATFDGKIGILQDDFSLKVIELGTPIRDFFEANDSRIAVLEMNNAIQDEKLKAKIYIVDLISGATQQEIVNGPQENPSPAIITLDKELKQIYYTSSDNLYIFDTQTQRITQSVQISPEDYTTYSTLIGVRNRYHGIWYYSRPGIVFEGPSPAIMLNMSTLKPVVNSSELLKDEQSLEFVIAPFGDNFLVGMNSRILLISPRGKIEEIYPLPNNLIGQGYFLLEYRN